MRLEVAVKVKEGSVDRVVPPSTHFTKLYSGSGVAVKVTVSPGLYVPPPVTVPFIPVVFIVYVFNAKFAVNTRSMLAVNE